METQGVFYKFLNHVPIAFSLRIFNYTIQSEDIKINKIKVDVSLRT
jgi:hypothetical protein